MEILKLKVDIKKHNRGSISESLKIFTMRFYATHIKRLKFIYSRTKE